MNSHDEVKKMIKSGQEKISPAIQHDLLKKITGKKSKDSRIILIIVFVRRTKPR